MKNAAKDLADRLAGYRYKGRIRHGRTSGACDACRRSEILGDGDRGNDRDPSDDGGESRQERTLPLQIKKPW